MTSDNQVEIVKKAKSGLLALSARTIILNILQVISRIVLARNLMPADFGAFGILQGWVGALMFFTDVGFGDILVRKLTAVPKSDFQNYFFVRTALAVISSVLFICIFPLLKNHYNLNFEFSSFAWVISIFILIDVLAACPMLLMGQRMEFVKIAKIELLGVLATYFIQIAFSFFIRGPWSLFVGLFAGKLISLFIAIRMIDDLPFPRFDRNFVKENIAQGLFFQLATILPSLQAIIFPFLLSLFVKIDQIGLIFWIEGLVAIPLSLIYNYNRVAFVSLSKFAEDRKSLSEVLASFLLPASLSICFVFGLGAVLAYNIISIVFGTKWMIATLYIHYSCLSLCLYSLRYLGLSVLSAVNKPKVRTANEIFFLISCSLLIYLLIPRLGIAGYFYGMITGNLLSLALMLFSIRQELQAAVFKRIFSALTAMLVAGLIIFSSGLNKEFFLLPFTFYAACFFALAVMMDPTFLGDIKKIFLKKLSLLNK